jgi:zinc transport system ATP-binding protein
VDLRELWYTYPGAGEPAIAGISLQVAPGERLGILGPNGGGKSTLLKIMLGLLTPDRGTVRMLGQDAHAARTSRRIGAVAQRNEIEWGMPLSVRQAVTLGASWGLSPWRRVPASVNARVDAMLRLVGAHGYSEQPIGRLSGGQLQRALIARALVVDPAILILDEPTVGIDAAGQAQFAQLLADVHASRASSPLGPLTLIIVSHDVRAIAAGCDRVACLSRTLHYHASPQGLTPQVLAEVFAHDIAGLSGPGSPLAGMHLHAHGPGEACPHEHTPAPASTPVTLGLPPSARPPGQRPGGPQ